MKTLTLLLKLSEISDLNAAIVGSENSDLATILIPPPKLYYNISTRIRIVTVARPEFSDPTIAVVRSENSDLAIKIKFLTSPQQ